jgi:ABC-type transport system substrate-binding protein
LYRVDSILTPVPDLAAAPCDVTADGLEVTCRLLPASFSDATPLTADDVKFTYDLARSRSCPFFNLILSCMDDLITAVDVLDQSTVRFTLSRLEPSFITGILPSVYIDSKALIERQFQVTSGNARQGRLKQTQPRGRQSLGSGRSQRPRWLHGARQ